MYTVYLLGNCGIVFLHKGATTEVILVYARENLHGDAKFSREYTSDDDIKEKCNLLPRSCQC